MSVQVVLRKLGAWSVPLVAEAPPGVIGNLEYFGHVAIVPGRLNPEEHGDELLTLARYVGVFRGFDAGEQATLSGVGMAAWLGDEDGKGDVIEHPGTTVTAATFANAIRAVLPAGGAVTEGTLFTGIPGTLTNTFSYVTPRAAVDYICDTMGNGATWRVNGDATLDAGPEASLFRTTPTCLIVRRGAGYDLGLRALPGDLESSRDAKEYSSRVVLIAAALAGGTADAGVVPYKDLHGNTVKITRVIDEQDDTLIANAPARAQAALAKVNGIRNSVRLAADEFDIAGDFEPGDTVWVYDPEAGIYDATQEVPFRGMILQPAAVRVLSVTWPVERGYTVAYRSSLTGEWTDLTPWVDWESAGSGQIEIADTQSTALTAGVGSIGTQVTGGGGGAGDNAVPDVPTFGAFTTTSYQPGNGLARAAIKATWTEPNNTDGSSIVDGDHYEIRYRPAGTSDWQTALVAFDQTSFTIVDLNPSTTYEFQIRCVDYATPANYGAWSTTTSQASADDTTPPATPAAPAVAASLIAVQVTHQLGLAAGGTFNLPLDMDHLRIHVGTSSGFTTSTANLVGKLPVNAAMIVGSVPAVGSYQVDTLVAAGATAYVKVVAVDRTGNESPSSAAASTSAQLIDAAHITSITASQITAGTITAAVVIGGSATFSGALSAATGTFAGSLSAATGTFSGALSAASGSFNGSISGASGTFTGNLSGSTITGATVVGSTLKTASSAARVEVGAGSGIGYIDFYDASSNSGYIRAGSSGGSNQLGMYSGSGSSWVQAHSGNASLNFSGGGVVSVTSSGAVLSAASAGNAQATASGNSLTLDASTITLGPGNNVNVNTSGSATTTIGNASDTTQIQSTTITVGNIPVTAGTTIAVKAVSRQLQLVSSARASKAEIRDADISVADALALRPVQFLARDELERNGGSTNGLTRHFGFIAEEVDEIEAARPLVVREDGAVIGLGYDRIPAVQQVVLRDHEARLLELAARLAALETS